MKIIPAIDLKDGKCVRLFQGDFDKSTEYSNDPEAIGRRFSALKVDNLHIVDLDGARTGRPMNRGIVQGIIAESGLEVQLGGGIRTRENVDRWLADGVSRCVVGSLAIKDPTTVFSWFGEFSADRLVLALDVRLDTNNVPILTTHGWTRTSGQSLWDFLDMYADTGLRHVLCTDVSRDGAMEGPNFDLYTEFLQRYPYIQLQASGGVRHIDDLQRLRELGVPAAITGRALLDGKISDKEVASFRPSE